MPKDHPFARLTVLPGRPELPQLWLLGSSLQSGIWAAELGLPYAFADFINPQGAEIVEYYRKHFTPSKTLPSPRVIVATSAICAETDEEAERIASSARMLFNLFFRGQLIQVPPIDEALAFLESDPVSADSPMSRRRVIIGSPERVRAGLEAVAAEYGAEEIMIVTITYAHQARRRSYELIAKALLA
jgi:luciferase family oxidoreductase group 1